MLRNEKGAGAAEAIVSLSAVLMVMMIFVPLLMKAVETLENKERDVMASRVLFEHLEEELFRGMTESNTYLREGEVYKVSRHESKVCIHYESLAGKSRAHCIEEDIKNE